MTLPLINRIYEFDNKKVIVWSIQWFSSIDYRTLVEHGGSEYKSANWWKFVFNAKKIGKIREVNV